MTPHLLKNGMLRVSAAREAPGNRLLDVVQDVPPGSDLYERWKKWMLAQGLWDDSGQGLPDALISTPRPNPNPHIPAILKDHLP